MGQKRTDAERRGRQTDRLARVVRLLQLILGHSRWNNRSIARELGCSERTVYRDMQVLRVAGIPFEFDERLQGYRVRPEFRFPLLNLTDEEALGQSVATTLAGVPGLDIGAGGKPTTRRLAAVSPQSLKRVLADAENLVLALDLKLADHTKHREIIGTIQRALLGRRQLVGRYRSPYEHQPVAVRLHPYRLCLMRQAWYMIARHEGRDQPQTFRVPRFEELHCDVAPALIPEDFDVLEYLGDAWGVYRGTPSYDVEVEFTREAAALVTETRWHHTQQARRLADGGVSLTFRVDGLDEIVWWILGWSGRVRVIQPPELRQRVAEQLRRGLVLNEQPESASPTP